MKIFMLVAGIALSHVVFASEFSVPNELKKDVVFWKMIFGKYHSGECVLHDPERLDMVYGVIKVSRQRAARKAKVESYKQRISAHLRKIAARQPVDDVFARALFKAIPSDLRTSTFLSKAAGRIRCQLGNADGFKLSLSRSIPLLPELKLRMRKNGLPEELAYLPHVESRFNPKAYSKVGASGLWQLMPASAREAGLTVGRWRDDRSDIPKATTAAIKILKRNYQKVGTWPLALTGYNYGINGVARGVKKLGTRDYMTFRKHHDSPSFGFAGRNFYPSFLAAVSLAKAREKDTSSSGSGLFF